MRQTILIVDDERMLLDLFREFLSGQYEVLVADSIDGAIRTLEQYTVHAVATDMNCGSGSGLDLLHWIKRHRPGLLAASFILSGSHEPEEMEGLAVPVIIKPVNLPQLQAVFASVLSGAAGDPPLP
jgi:DNA-binding NtrC family response regulator